ncbi:MAG TPA: DUF4912 domain-containing protein, partial [Symbiobacteriaceae bacterium]|nr:DUF4912 domain-containing protein [Symbiobacteriaceae bacterium]
LGATRPGESDGEGGFGAPGRANLTENHRENRGKVVQFRNRPGAGLHEDAAVFEPAPDWGLEFAEDVDWSGLDEHVSLPAHYNEDATVALVRNPRSLYVYWERYGHGEENLRGLLGEDAFRQTAPCLRVFDVSSGAFPGQDSGHCLTIDVSEDTDHWFVNDGIVPGRRYIASFGRRTPEGRYYLMSHSPAVETPHDGPTPETEQTMMYRTYMSQPGGRLGVGNFPGSQWR